MIVATSTSSPAELSLAPWRRHNGRLLMWSLISILAAVALWLAASTIDGREPFRASVAIEFVIWSAINLGFAISGYRGVAGVRSRDASTRDKLAMTKAREILRLLGINTWLNLLWLTIGVALTVWGYYAWSASLVGHGLGVLVQAIVLTVLDAIFVRELRVVCAERA